MTTATFCQEVEPGVTQHQIDGRVNDLKTLGGALDAYAKTIGEKRYICDVRKVFDKSLDDNITNPDREPNTNIATLSSTIMPTIPTETVKRLLLVENDYLLAAKVLGCEVAAIRAVADVESGGRTGFLPDGRPKIPFESHVFSNLTDNKRKHPANTS